MSKVERVDQMLLRDWDSITYALVPEEEELTLSPEQRLFLAVIVQAVDDATSPSPSLHRDQARSVIFSASATNQARAASVVSDQSVMLNPACSSRLRSSSGVARKLVSGVRAQDRKSTRLNSSHRT